MKNFTFCLLIFLLPLFATGQKGFQFGLGINQITIKNQPTKYLNENKVKTSNLYGASLNVDYRFNNEFKLKSGLEYKSQNIDFQNLSTFRAEYISIPLIFNYAFLKFEKAGLSFGIDAGVSFDKPVIQSIDLLSTSRESELNKETIARLQVDTDRLPTRVFEFNDYLSLRLGITATYNLGKRGLLNFFAHSTNYGFDWDFPFRVNEQVIIDGEVVSNKLNVGNLNISNTGIQFGLYYTFGTLTFK